MGGWGRPHRHEKVVARLYCVPLLIKVYSGQPRKARGEYICVSTCGLNQRQLKKSEGSPRSLRVATAYGEG